jgi:hypothetical protein
MLEKKIGFSTDRHKKIPCPLPLSLIKLLGMQMFQDCACKLLRKTNKIARIIGTKF